MDAGEYKAVARNKLGEAICHATLQLGMVPDHPSWPVLEYLSSTEMTLSWQPPEFDGNSDILAFRYALQSVRIILLCKQIFILDIYIL